MKARYAAMASCLPVKAEAAQIFKQWWDKIRADEDYLQRKQAHQKKWG
jgi:hypothetical protein